MPHVARSALINFSAGQMYDLVNDVGAYPAFLPGCVESKILQQEPNYMKASLKVSKGGISQWFSTENHLIPNEKINMNLVDGPFKSLTGGWTFTPLADNACKVELNLHFEFSNKLVEMAFGKIFSQLTANMVDAFTQRAKQVYV